MGNLYVKIIVVAGFCLSTMNLFAADVTAGAFKLKRGVGACSNLPTEADHFECKAIGWPDQTARVDLVRQEFVNKYGRTVRWGLFDYYYFFHGTKKCEPVKDMIIGHLTERKDLDDLWQKLGDKSECVRKGQGWIQTRNIEVWDGSGEKSEKPSKEAKAQPMKKQNRKIAKVTEMVVPPAKPAPEPAIAPTPMTTPPRKGQRESFPKEFF